MSIKIEISRMAPGTERAIQRLIQQLTGKQLALVMLSLDAHWHKARAYERKEILSEGCIWSDSQHPLLLEDVSGGGPL